MLDISHLIGKQESTVKTRAEFEAQLHPPLTSSEFPDGCFDLSKPVYLKNRN